MKTSFAALFFFLGLGCGDDALPTPPDLAERETPAGIAPPMAPSIDAGVTTPPDNPGGEIECCEIRFALRDFNGLEDEASAHLRGTDAPLLDGDIPLTFADGEWSASACLPVGAAHGYFFEFGLTPDSGEGLFLERRANPNAPLVDGGRFGTINEVAFLEDCSADFSVHADTTASMPSE